MTKELEAFEKIKLGYICGQGAINEFALRENERENFNIIETALNEGNGIKSSLDFLYEEFNIKDFADLQKHLKEHEEHKQILNDYGLSLVDFRHACFTFAQFKNSKGFEGVEKKLKAIEIIKEKLLYIDFKLLLSSTDYEVYCFMVGNGKLTKAEYDLLKEVLL